MWKSALLAMTLSTATLSAQSPWQEGKPLPPLRLPTIEGDRTVDLADLRGKKLLLVEFASW